LSIAVVLEDAGKCSTGCCQKKAV